MSLITTYNYEAYLLDYVEENLSPVLIAELMLFFENNPELKEDLTAFEIHELKPAQAEVLDKTLLKKEIITALNYEDVLIAEVEGLNTPETSRELMLFLTKNPTLNAVSLAYQQTKLIGEKVIFNDKEALFKKNKKVIPLYWWSAVAAVLVALVWIKGVNVSVERQYNPLVTTTEIVIDAIEKENLMKVSVFDSANTQSKASKKRLIPAVEITESRIDTEKKLNDGLVKKTPVVLVPLKQEKVEVLIAAQLMEEKPKIASPSDSLIEEHKEAAVLLAENSVVITYEDEVDDNGTPESVKKKMTKLGLIRKAIGQQLKAKVLARGRDGVLLAVNSKAANFIRGKDKN